MARMLRYPSSSVKDSIDAFLFKKAMVCRLSSSSPDLVAIPSKDRDLGHVDISQQKLCILLQIQLTPIIW